MRLYHFLEARWALEDIRHRRLKVSRLDKLNDPFEYLAIDLSDRPLRLAFMRTREHMSKRHGIICFCDNWHSPPMWAHYGERYRGICLGFDVNVTGDALVAMQYVKHRLKPPVIYNNLGDPIWSEFFKKMTASKFEQWSYEGEHRLHVSLDEPDPIAKDETGEPLYFLNFGAELVLREVIIGAQSLTTRTEIKEALGPLSSAVETFKSRPGFGEFKIVRNKRELAWT